MAQTYRYVDRIALAVTGATRYLEPKDAIALANHILAVASEIDNVPRFSESTIGTVNVPDYAHG